MYQFIKRNEQSAHHCLLLRHDRNIFNGYTKKQLRHRLCLYAMAAAIRTVKTTFQPVHYRLAIHGDKSRKTLMQTLKHEWYVPSVVAQFFWPECFIRSIETNNVRLINNWGKAFLLLSFGLCRLFSALSPSGIHSQNCSIITAGFYWRAPKMDINRSNWWNNGWSKLLGQSWNQFAA